MDTSEIKLHPYQEKGVEWLIQKRFALLADVPGLGKSAQAIRASDRVKPESILVVCPANLRVNWLREFEKFSKHEYPFKLIETAKDFNNKNDFAICSYDLAETISKKRWGLVIADESHYLKSKKAKRTKTVLGSGGLAHRTERMWCLSGTPAPNHVGELWVLLHTFGATKLNYQDFITEFCNTVSSPYGYMQRQVVGTNLRKIPELKAMLRPVMLRRLLLPGMLPEVSFHEHPIERGEVPEGVWVGLKEQLAQLELFLEEDGSLQGLEALAPSISTLRRWIGLQKVEAVASIIEEELIHNHYQKIVIFAWHTSVLEGLADKLKNFNLRMLHGSHTQNQKQKAVDDFQKDPNVRVFLGNIQAAGVGITLTASSEVAFVEESWVPADNEQAWKRCNRLTQTKPLRVRNFNIYGSLDEKISRILKQKTKELTKLLDHE